MSFKQVVDLNQSRMYSSTISIVPEPGTFSLLAGALALSWVMLRRRG
jgi:hypothetical protein